MSNPFRAEQFVASARSGGTQSVASYTAENLNRIAFPLGDDGSGYEALYRKERPRMESERRAWVAMGSVVFPVNWLTRKDPVPDAEFPV